MTQYLFIQEGYSLIVEVIFFLQLGHCFCPLFWILVASSSQTHTWLQGLRITLEGLVEQMKQVREFPSVAIVAFSSCTEVVSVCRVPYERPDSPDSNVIPIVSARGANSLEGVLRDVLEVRS